MGDKTVHPLDNSGPISTPPMGAPQVISMDILEKTTWAIWCFVQATRKTRCT